AGTTNSTHHVSYSARTWVPQIPSLRREPRQLMLTQTSQPILPYRPGDARPECLIAVDAELPLGGGAVGEHRIGVTHHHDRPVAAADAGNLRCHAIAKKHRSERSHGEPRRFEPGLQPPANGIDAALVVAAGIDVHEIR